MNPFNELNNAIGSLFADRRREREKRQATQSGNEQLRNWTMAAAERAAEDPGGELNGPPIQQREGNLFQALLGLFRGSTK